MSWGLVECPTAGRSKRVALVTGFAETTHIKRKRKETWHTVLMSPCCWSHNIALLENFQAIPSAWIISVFTINLLLECIGLEYKHCIPLFDERAILLLGYSSTLSIKPYAHEQQLKSENICLSCRRYQLQVFSESNALATATHRHRPTLNNDH